jgi:Arc/MetJ-type ribon-helix-helix transcriptional regulator
MVSGMATTKITITIDNEQLDQIRELIAKRQASSVSGFVKHAIRVALHDAAGWKEMLKGALLQSGGPLTKKERAWADTVLQQGGQKRRVRRKSAA